MEIRGRTAADDSAIRRLNDDAFGGPSESRLIEDLRAAGLAAVELVAVEDDQIVGHILFSVLATTMDHRAVPALALAPMAVRADRQRCGIGSASQRGPPTAPSRTASERCAAASVAAGNGDPVASMARPPS